MGTLNFNESSSKYSPWLTMYLSWHLYSNWKHFWVASFRRAFSCSVGGLSVLWMVSKHFLFSRTFILQKNQKSHGIRSEITKLRWMGQNRISFSQNVRESYWSLFYLLLFTVIWSLQWFLWHKLWLQYFDFN